VQLQFQQENTNIQESMSAQKLRLIAVKSSVLIA
jgi:hypothetical protein